jgi:hypothetical protein
MSLLSIFELFEDEEAAMKSFEEQPKPAAACSCSARPRCSNRSACPAQKKEIHQGSKGRRLRSQSFPASLELLSVFLQAFAFISR